MDEEESEPFTDIYWIKFVKIANARYSLFSKAFLKREHVMHQSGTYIHLQSIICL